MPLPAAFQPGGSGAADGQAPRDKDAGPSDAAGGATHTEAKQEGGAAGTSGTASMRELFRCHHPSCGKLLYRPSVLSCGHVVCMDTCMPESESESRAASGRTASTSGGGATEAGARSAATSMADVAGPSGAGAAADRAAGHATAAHAAATTAAGAVGPCSPGASHDAATSPEAAAGGPAAAPYGRCPCCRSALVYASTLCGKLHEALLALFPADSEARRAEVEAALRAAGRTAGSRREAQAAGPSLPCVSVQLAYGRVA